MDSEDLVAALRGIICDITLKIQGSGLHTMRSRKKLYKNFNTHLILHFSILIIFVLLILGCGKKAPPVPPRQAKPPTGHDLRASIIDRGTLKLTCAIPVEKGTIMPSLSGFIVYRSKMLHSDSNCKISPVLFKRVTDILTEVSASGYIKKVLLRTLNSLKRAIGISIM